MSWWVISTSLAKWQPWSHQTHGQQCQVEALLGFAILFDRACQVDRITNSPVSRPKACDLILFGSADKISSIAQFRDIQLLLWFVIAGRHLPFYRVTATVFAIWFGSETVLGIPATFLKEGLHGVVADPFGTSMCTILVGLLFAVPLYAMNSKSGIFKMVENDRQITLVMTLFPWWQGCSGSAPPPRERWQRFPAACR